MHTLSALNRITMQRRHKWKLPHQNRNMSKSSFVGSRVYFTEDGNAEDVTEHCYVGDNISDVSDIPSSIEDEKMIVKYSKAQSELSKHCEIDDDPHSPECFITYLYLLGLFDEYPTVLQALQEYHDTTEALERAGRWKKASIWTRDHFNPQTWSWAICVDMRAIFGDTRVQQLDVSGFSIESFPFGTIAKKIVDSLRETEFLRCFENEPTLELNLACVTACMFSLFIISSVTDAASTSFRCVLKEFDVTFDRETIIALNNWKNKNENIDFIAFNSYAMYIIRDVFENEEKYLSE